MAGQACFDLDLLIDRDGDRYRARVLRSPAGDGQAVTFTQPFSDLELENFLLKMGRSRGRTRRIESTSVTAAKQFGGRLFSAVFTGQVGECLRRSVDRAQDEDATLRIRLRLADCPGLADLPWEFLYDKDDDWFVALSGATPVVRYLQLPNQPRPLSVTLPLRVLAVRSEPADHPPLDLEAEWSQVMTALREFTDSGAITVTDLAAPTLSELRRVLLRERFHVLHYMGHGGFTAEDGGVLLFTDRTGRGVPVTGEQLSVMLRDHTSLRLAVLNACEAGRSDPTDPFGGIADTLVRRGIPAVIAMQFEISDTAAAEFAPALYGALAAGRPVDAAVAEGRKAIYAVSALEWATPVLHLRADNAQLFDITEPALLSSPGQAPSAQAPQDPVTGGESHNRSTTRPSPESASTHAELGSVLIDQGRYQEAEAALREAIRLDRGHTSAHNDLGYLLNELQQYEEAETVLREAIRLDPENSNAHNNLGFALNELRRHQEGETVLREAIRLDPENSAAHNNLGFALNELQRYREAETILREAIRLDPENSNAHYNLGFALNELKRCREAETVLREAIRLDPDHALSHNSLGFALNERQRHPEAETVLREAIRLDPDDTAAHNNLGYALEGMKRYAEAVVEYQCALRLDRENAAAEENLARVRRTRRR
ncbi:MAG TPA: tetratricopeptide repeat protein [Trebonia sp.]|nr:tetratricopeptide repeat protein [Trebonia sp.]